MCLYRCLQEPVKFHQRLGESAEATRENCCRSPLCILRSEPLNEWNMLSRCYRLSTENWHCHWKELANDVPKSPANLMLLMHHRKHGTVTSGIDCTFMSGVVSKYLWYFNHGNHKIGNAGSMSSRRAAMRTTWEHPVPLAESFGVNVSGHVSPVPYPLLWMVKWSTAVNEILYKSDVTVANYKLS